LSKNHAHFVLYLYFCAVCCVLQGKKCAFSHDCEVEKKQEVCKFYLLSTCTKGLACPYYHDILVVRVFHVVVFLVTLFIQPIFVK